MAPWTQHLDEQGFAILRGVFGPLDIQVLSAAFDRILTRAQNLQATYKSGITEFRVIDIQGKPTFKFAKWASAEDEVLNDYRLDPRLLEPLRTRLGEDLKQITNQMHYKIPGDGVSFQFHQDCSFRQPDAAYRDLGRSFLQCAVAIDAATTENGCLQFIPGSHRESRPLLAGGYEDYAAGNAANAEVLARFPAPVNALLAPGDMALWTAYTIHGSAENRSAKPRRTYINGFCSAANTDHGIWALRQGRIQPLVVSPETQWDHVEER